MIIDRKPVVIVSGLPRSGTSMMMEMLVAGGLEALTDNIRTADLDNPKGYYEFEKVKELERDSSWMDGARGKGVKIISFLLKHLPQNYDYKIIFMRRKMDEILASQRQMLIRRGEPTDAVSDERLSELFEKHLKYVESWIDKQPNIQVIYVNYNDALENTACHIENINAFLGNILDPGKMEAVIDRALYRQRK